LCVSSTWAYDSSLLVQSCNTADTIKLFRSLIDSRSEGPLNSASIVDVSKYAHGMQCSTPDKSKVILGNVQASDGSCWRHVHWNERSIVDFGQAPITTGPALKIVGDNWEPPEAFPLGLCEGDVSRDLSSLLLVHIDVCKLISTHCSPYSVIKTISASLA